MPDHAKHDSGHKMNFMGQMYGPRVSLCAQRAETRGPSGNRSKNTRRWADGARALVQADSRHLQVAPGFQPL